MTPISTRSAPLSGRTALVTGSARRLGRAIALALAGEGADVAVHYGSSSAEAQEVAGRIDHLGRRSALVEADLADPQQAAGLLDEASKRIGRPIDLLVNNASLFPSDGLMDFPRQALAENVQVNAFAPLQLCRAMAEKGVEGDIINLLDSRYVDADTGHVSYHLSKRMLHAITRLLAMELAPAIKVNAIAPGLILPPPGEDEQYLERLAHTNPLHRHGSADEISAAALFLVRSEFITGQVLFVDGGRHMKGCVYG
jgi:hypothetical protein